MKDNIEQNNYELPFDLYTRNKIISDLISLVAMNKKGLKILDFGGRNGYLGKFIRECDDLYILDIRKPELKENNYILGNINCAPLKDRSFDLVVSSDVYEHISPEYRNNALLEMQRISKNLIILGAPFRSNENEEAEQKANAFFSRINGFPHPWLDEHIRNVLPEESCLEALLASTRYEYFKINTNNTQNWLMMQLFIFYANKYGLAKETIGEVNGYYNKNYIFIGDCSLPSYRKIYIFWKAGSIQRGVFREYEIGVNEFDLKKYKMLIFVILTSILDQDHLVSEKDRQIQALSSQLREAMHVIADHDKYMNEAEAQFRAREVRPRILDNLQANIKKTVFWRGTMNPCSKFLEYVFPNGTVRRRFYDLGLDSKKILADKGLYGFLLAVKAKIYKDMLRNTLTAKPIVETEISEVENPTKLFLENELNIIFRFPINGLNEIKIHLSTSDGPNSDLILNLKQYGCNEIIRKRKLDRNHVPYNDYISFRFKPITDSADKIYSLSVKSTGGKSSAMWYAPNYSPESVKLFYGNLFIAGIINFRAYARTKIKDPFELWVIKNEPTSEQLSELRDKSLAFKYKPKISIITPVWNTDKIWLQLAIESVLRQVYDNWELCIADGGSTNNDVKIVLDKYAKKDGRIKIKYLSENKGIAGNSNEALSLASGEFIAFLDHDDELAPFALFEVIKAINQKPDVEFLYSDRDKITPAGKRFDPFFKPNWSPEYLLSQNYLCHLNVVRKDLLDRIGGFRYGYDGSQDYDLYLRITEQTDKIIHIPKLLYHWRAIPSSAATDMEVKSYAIDAAIRALQDAVKRRGWNGIVTQGTTRGLYRINFKLDNHPKVSIIIPTKDKSSVLNQCVESILNKTTYDNYEVIIVDNQSTEEETFQYYTDLATDNKIKIIKYNESFNFSKINNFAVSQTNSEFILFLNNDVEVITDNWIELMIGFAQLEKNGAVGIKLIYPNDKIQHAGLILDEMGNVRRAHHDYPRDSLGYAGRIQSIQNFSAVAAACMMVRRNVFEEVGGLDPEFVVAHGDIDFCLKLIQHGYSIVYEPHAELYHHESLTRGYEDTPEKIERLRRETDLLMQKWGHVLKVGDPYSNPNLTTDREDFAIRI